MSCERLNSRTDGIVTVDNEHEITPDTTIRTIGTEVTVTCESGYNLVGQSTFTCQPNGQWSYDTKPYCTKDSGSTDETMLDEDTKILIGVISAVAGLIVIVLIAMLIAVFCYKRNRRSKQDRLVNSRVDEYVAQQGMLNDYRPYTVDYDDGYGNRREDFEPGFRGTRGYTIDVTNFYPPPYDTSPVRDFYASGRPLAFRGGPYDYVEPDYPEQRPYERQDVYLQYPDRRPVRRAISLEDVQPDRGNRRSSPQRQTLPRRPIEPNKPYIGDWMPSDNHLDEFNTRALLHGRDPFLWRPVHNNWGFNVQHKS